MLIVVLLVVESCAKVPITGRKQFNLLPESQLMSMSLTQYGTFLQENEALPESDNRVQMVRSVGNRIAKAVEAYLIENHLDKRIKNFEWEFNVVDKDVINAWCMPGGKVCFYTGILPLTQTETGLAVVMGHEIAHAIARHGNERMSQGMAIQIGGVGLSKAVEEQPDIVQNIFFPLMD